MQLKEAPKPTVALLLRITCFFWLLAKVISRKVWGSDRFFPVVPLFGFLDNVPGWVHGLLFGAALICLVLLIIKPSGKYLLPVLIIIEICSCSLDQNRWQPWEYQYLFTIFIIAINRNNYNVARYAFTFLLITTYIYSGLNKMSIAFLHTIWDRMILTAFLKLPAHVAHNGVVYYSGYLLGIIECAAGIGLFFPRLKKLSAWVLIGMHLFNLLFLGPFGLKYNKIIWPWNVVMIVYLYILFIRKDSVPISFSHFYQLRKGYNKLVILCWGILPAFSFIGWWDNYLSSSLYSGRVPTMAICINNPDSLTSLRPYFSKTDTLHICDGAALINTQSWALKEINVPPYPEQRVYKKIQEKFSQKYPGVQCKYVLYHYTYNGELIKQELK